MKLSFFLATAFFCLSFVTCYGQHTISDEQATKALRHFYVYYIKEACKVSSETAKMDSLLRRYSTDCLTLQLKEQDEEGVDYFLDTNTYDIGWLKTLVVTKDIKGRDIYVASYTLDFPHAKKEIKKIKLRLIKKADGISIDRIIR